MIKMRAAEDGGKAWYLFNDNPWRIASRAKPLPSLLMKLTKEEERQLTDTREEKGENKSTVWSI